MGSNKCSISDEFCICLTSGEFRNLVVDIEHYKQLFTILKSQ